MFFRSPSETFEHMSFVNAVWTSKGGAHVTYVMNQIVKAIDVIVNKKKAIATSAMIRNKFMVFVNCSIENTSFDSQSKDSLTTRPSQFGSECELPKKFLNEIISNSGIVREFEELASRNDKISLINSVRNRGKTFHVPKLEDAHLAGTKSSLDCSLILTEGDSAKSLAIAGIEVVGRTHYGVLPLRGKVLNVRDKGKGKLGKKLIDHSELLNICKAVGLDPGKTYEGGLENQGLRYGHVILMTDQDTDGSHIKGLIINFFHFYWPHLLRVDGFLQQFSTPLIKVRMSEQVSKRLGVKDISRLPDSKGLKAPLKIERSPVIKSFYSFQEYDQWLQSVRRDMEWSNGNVSSKVKNTAGTDTDVGAKPRKAELNSFSVKYYKGIILEITMGKTE